MKYWKLCTVYFINYTRVFKYEMGLAFCDQPFNRNLIARFLRRKSHIERTRWQVSYQCWSLWGMDAVKWIDKCILLSDTINHRLFIWPVVIPNEPLIGHFVIFFPKQIAGGSKLFTPRMSIVFRDLLRSFLFRSNSQL